MTQSNLKIAITGGIGSGKSAVSEIIEKYGFAVVSCDVVYRELLAQGVFDDSLKSNFGNEIFIGETLDKGKLANIVFNDESALKKLNEITHPVIMNEALKRIMNEKIGFIEVPLLFENGFEKFFDGILVVLRDRETRIASIIKRDKITLKEAILRINAQFDYDNAEFAKYYVIHNSGNFGDLETAVSAVLKKITENF